MKHINLQPKSPHNLLCSLKDMKKVSNILKPLPLNAWNDVHIMNIVNGITIYALNKNYPHAIVEGIPLEFFKIDTLDIPIIYVEIHTAMKGIPVHNHLFFFEDDKYEPSAPPLLLNTINVDDVSFQPRNSISEDITVNENSIGSELAEENREENLLVHVLAMKPYQRIQWK
jgi:hypothetical protein